MKIAIDGPAGAGKSTVARRIAEELGILYVDTGAMYRALTWKGLRETVNLLDSEQLQELAAGTMIDLIDGPDGVRVFCDGQEVTEQIRTPEISRWVSVVAADQRVREIMVSQQRSIAERNDVVMDGRDITHCVLPDAEFKFFLTASLEERTYRRQLELEKKGYQVDRESLAREIAERDRQDSERAFGALKITPDAMVIDTTLLGTEAVIQKVLGIVQEA